MCKLKQLTQIVDEKDSFEVLLGGSVSGTLCQTGFEMGSR